MKALWLCIQLLNLVLQGVVEATASGKQKQKQNTKKPQNQQTQKTPPQNRAEVFLGEKIQRFVGNFTILLNKATVLPWWPGPRSSITAH